MNVGREREKVIKAISKKDKRGLKGRRQERERKWYHYLKSL